MLVLGEIRTCLLRNSGTASQAVVADLLRLSPGDLVRLSERPLAHGVSPEVINGVDCRMPSASGTRIRGIGTVAARGVVTGGRILQGSVYARLERGRYDRRLPWSHYLANPGTIETLSRFNPRDVYNGFLSTPPRDSTLDLGAQCERLIGNVQKSPRIDHVVPFKSRRTRLCWAARTTDGPESPVGGEFVIADDTLRTFGLILDNPDTLHSVVEFCEDLALHDWILSTLLQLVERSNLGSNNGTDALSRVRPAIDHLLHLWMPGARVAQSLQSLWESLERRPGFTRQWDATKTRIRDQLAVHTLTMLVQLHRIAPEKLADLGGAGGRSR